jgi:hypothetical protein
LVVHVAHAISIVVRIGAAVFVLKAVEVLGRIRAFVDVVRDPVSIAIVRHV